MCVRFKMSAWCIFYESSAGSRRHYQSLRWKLPAGNTYISYWDDIYFLLKRASVGRRPQSNTRPSSTSMFCFGVLPGILNAQQWENKLKLPTLKTSWEDKWICWISKWEVSVWKWHQLHLLAPHIQVCCPFSRKKTIFRISCLHDWWQVIFRKYSCGHAAVPIPINISRPRCLTGESMRVSFQPEMADPTCLENEMRPNSGISKRNMMFTHRIQSVVSFQNIVVHVNITRRTLLRLPSRQTLSPPLYLRPPSGKKVQIRKPAPGLSDVAPLRRTSRPVIISSSTIKKGTPQHRPLRERLTHLLALKPYKKPELILRLQKDGLLPLDKDSLDSYLQQVSHTHTHILLGCLFRSEEAHSCFFLLT